MSLPLDDGSRVIREREIVNVFLACGIYENIAKDIVKTTPELAVMTEKSADVFKSVLREALSILEKEGVPDIKLAEEPTNQISDTPRKVKLNLCKICKDSAAIHASFPDVMRKFFRRTQKFRGELAKDDWLCKSCYADWYREYREDIAEIQAGSYVDKKPEEEVVIDENEEEKKRQPKKEFYVKTIVLLLWQVVRFLDPKAISHRKMLIRYIAKNQIHLNQMGTVLWYLRKVGNGILDQEEFEKICGIGEQYEELFGYAIWHESHTKSDILRLNEAERRKRKEEKERERKKALEEEKAKIEEDKREALRVKQLKDALELAEKEAEEKTRAEKWRKLKEARKNEDDNIKESREREDQLKEKRKDKKEQDNKKKRQLRELELKGVENACKKREEELQRKKDERYRKQRQEMAARLAERKESMLDDLRSSSSGKKL